jgi:hypothetical protein
MITTGGLIYNSFHQSNDCYNVSYYTRGTCTHGEMKSYRVIPIVENLIFFYHVSRMNLKNVRIKLER